ncbi:Tol-Pal system beta propeller repeat protein TolB [Alkalilimnicola sp. S0819]|uniref:Tol-Pal system beta propeller repeat protein TolB n=1 Tax=Alkalilimnicola sp. S0819 TaxID=2613922 RepID=UPI001261B52C|nr:Tol-Pal system beta propeller repeat protein TolB [Alkalilimnicola sp. S0819]KAB7628282.1 Tol-Pal system beta propeller repeat protein TolB [Alkalilimnicola sp. S0819]MPQ15178.1 Tol-Pal system beta propeller repeat protein TolB [Alkalilimnicola sp. S0819]
MRRLSILTTLLLGFALCSASAQALEIRITGGSEGALPIAIVPFGVEGTAPEENLAAIIRGNLERSGRFEPLPSSDFLERPQRLEDVTFPNWRAIGADNLLIGRLRELNGGRYELTYELLDSYRGERLGGKRYRVEPQALRTLAHRISDDIYATLIGRPGVFGTQIAYIAVEEANDTRLHKLMLADADGHRPQTILTSAAPLMSPAWSADRGRIAYVSFEGRRSEIYVQTVATGERRKVASFAGINGAPAWSPDGRHLAIASSRDGNADIFVLDLASGQSRPLTRHYGIDTEPTWTPDGKHILFTSDRGGRPQIYRVPVAGGKAERVSFEGDYNAAPDLSPDGRLLTMVHRGGKGGFRIAVQDLETGQLRVLTDGPLDESPSFAGNGDLIVYGQSINGRRQLATVSVHGRADQPLRLAPHTLREPAWGPLPDAR